MMGPGSTMTTTSKKRQKGTSNGCFHCGLPAHGRITSRLCWKNPSRFAEEKVVLAAEDKIGKDPKQSNDEEVARQVTGTDIATNNTNHDKKKED
jgi:hypothetical protein